MAEIPANQKLWSTLVAQAKARFRVYPSPASAHWVHSQYIHLGGQFVSSEKKVDPRFKDNKKDVKKTGHVQHHEG